LAAGDLGEIPGLICLFFRNCGVWWILVLGKSCSKENKGYSTGLLKLAKDITRFLAVP